MKRHHHGGVGLSVVVVDVGEQGYLLEKARKRRLLAVILLEFDDIRGKLLDIFNAHIGVFLFRFKISRIVGVL